MRRANYIVDVLLTISFIMVFITGVIKFPGLLSYLGISYASIPIGDISTLHNWSGIFMAVLVFIHLALHWRILFRRRK
ncbi:MAG: DUF4405 domain-containing protein [Nanoarchaeota archaeon]|nr:DUF4405 domain-containing protein [Nanoarchaeota archaeon]